MIEDDAGEATRGVAAGTVPGVLPSQALEEAIAAEWIGSGDYRIRSEAIQPASIDLRLGDFAWALRCSFLPDVDSTVEEMVRATERGLLVTRFHYSNIVNPMESSITGMTRDGTFLIERGEVVGPVMNLRFTQSILAALSSVSMVGREAHLASEFFFSASRVPALRIDEFHFSGVSDH